MSEAYQQPAPDDQTPDQSQSADRQLSHDRAVELLQTTIQQLEQILDKLRAEPGQLPPAASVETLVISTKEIETFLDFEPKEVVQQEAPAIASSKEITPTEPVAAELATNNVAQEAVEEWIEEPTLREPLPAESKGVDRLFPSFDRLQAVWDRILLGIRAILPGSIGERLSDWGLTGIVAGTVVILLATSVLLLPQPPKPEVGEIPQIEIETPPELEAPEPPQPVEPIAPPEVEPATPPELELTPEQGLIAAIQDQVAQLTSAYAEGLIQSIEANFLGSRLTVRVGDDWYTLNKARQSELANEMLRRSRELDFRKLEIVDNQETLLARSPVVGQSMVILEQ